MQLGLTCVPSASKHVRLMGMPCRVYIRGIKKAAVSSDVALDSMGGLNAVIESP